MFASDSYLRLLILALCALAVFGGSVTAQRDHEESRKLAESWLESDQTSMELRGAVSKALLQDPKVGLAWLGKQLPAAAVDPNLSRSKGVYDLCTAVTLEFLREAQKSDFVFVGQYKPLAALKPYVVDLLFLLLLDTPQWYPLTFRERLVPALRDLQLEAPSLKQVDDIIAIIENDREPVGLRHALAAMMWQWGQRDHAQAVIIDLVRATTEGDDEDRVQSTVALAEYYSLLREYKSSANSYRALQVMAKKAEVRLQPVVWYAAACVFALSGDSKRGMEAIKRCAEMHASPHLDASLRLKRELFEDDPEIESLRKLPGFAELVKLAFGAKSEDEPPKDRR
jgi:hypothetical protein